MNAIIKHIPVISTIYNWAVDKWDNYILAWRATTVSTIDNNIVPATNVIISDRGIALPLFDYCVQTIV